MSSRTLVGDVFAVSLGTNKVGFFQYVARDLSQLNSPVVRVFKEKKDDSDSFDADQIARGDVDFYAHVFINVGLKLKTWWKVSHADIVGETNVLFRDSSDYGKSKERISSNWFVWRIDEPFVNVGPLRGANCNAEIGIVVPPSSLVWRMNNGVYDFYYPEPGP